MNYGKFTLEELKNGYTDNKEKDAYFCNHCNQKFPKGQIFRIENNFYTAEYAVEKHIITEHEGNLMQLLYSNTKYNTLTQNQKDLLTFFYSNTPDKEIAKKLNIAESTVRHQRFSFHEKAKQAKFYLSIYEQIFNSSVKTKPLSTDPAIDYVNGPYTITEQEKQHILETSFLSLEPLILKNFSPKEKKKIVILKKIAEQFKPKKQYSEKEINEILKPIFHDYITIRRYLIMYGFMDRTKEGSKYWLIE